MQISYERLWAPSAAELEKIQRIYEANFPAAERKPFDYFLPRILAGSYICMVARTEGEILGFALLMVLPEAPVAFLEYVAVDQSCHGQGVGSGLFQWMAAYCRESELAKGVLWEVEPPTDDLADDANRRIRFYERLGAKLISLSSCYAMPNFESRSGGVPLRLMQLPLEHQPYKAEVEAMVRGIYSVAYPEWADLRDEVLRLLPGA